MNDPPSGSPVMTTLEKPPPNTTPINSFALLPISPPDTKFAEKSEVDVLTRLLEELNAWMVSGNTYVKRPENDTAGESKRIVIGPPSSVAELTPEKGGKSSSLSEMPEVRTVVCEKVNPGIWVVTTSESLRLSKFVKMAAALT